MPKCITLYQPWATLIAVGYKRIETRSWQTEYRGEIYIHAGKTIDFDACARLQQVLGLAGYSIARNLPTGMIIARCVLRDCRPIMAEKGTDWPILWSPYEELVVGEDERKYGDFRPGRWGWMVDHVSVVNPPIRARGQMGLWDYEGGRL